MIEVRRAHPGAVAAVANVIDGGGLAVSHETVVERLRAGDVLVAAGDSTSILGAIVLAPADRPQAGRILAVAVRRRRRDQGIGTRLVAAAATRYSRLVAECDADVVAFYRGLGFRTWPVGPERFRGDRFTSTAAANEGRPPVQSDGCGAGLVARPP